MPDDDNPRKDVPEEDLDAEIAELEQKLQEAAAGMPLSDEDEDRVIEIAEKLETEAKLEAFLEHHQEGIDALQSIAEEVKVDRTAPDFDSEFHEKLASIEERARIARTRRGTGLKSPDAERQIRSDRESAKGLGTGLGLAYLILGTPMAGLGIGWLIDVQTDSNAFKAFFMLGGAVLGVILAVMLMNREQNKP
ncbi:MAG: hypothetical protein KF784_00690 [Fimbriimonadaceae bacterium]|nr:hypothetical protein [Fimbriimonadaceae bacterium]